MSEASIGPQRNGKPPPSSAFSFSQSDKNLLNITDSFAAFSAEQVSGSYDIAYRKGSLKAVFPQIPASIDLIQHSLVNLHKASGKVFINQ